MNGKGKVRSIASPPPPKPPALSNADYIFKEVYDEAKAAADGGVVLFYNGGVFVTFLDDAMAVGDAIGVLPHFAAGGARLSLIVRNLKRNIRIMRDNGIDNIWMWTRVDGVKPFIG